MAQTLETLLQNIWNTNDHRRLLNDGDYFLQAVASQYRPEFKADCKLLEKGIRVGAGNIVDQYMSQRTKPDELGRNQFCRELQNRAGLTYSEAIRVVELLSIMVGWTNPVAVGPGMPINSKAIRDRARNNLKQQFGVAFLAMLLAGIIPVALNIIPVIGNIAFIIISGPLAVGSMRVFMNVASGVTASTNQLFQPFSDSFGESFLTWILHTIFILLWSLLLVIPGIIMSYSYAMTFYVMNREKIHGKAAIDRSRELMKGHRGELFTLYLSFIPWYLLEIITFGLATIWVGPYVATAETVFFDAVYASAHKY